MLSFISHSLLSVIPQFWACSLHDGVREFYSGNWPPLFCFFTYFSVYKFSVCRKQQHLDREACLCTRLFLLFLHHKINVMPSPSITPSTEFCCRNAVIGDKKSSTFTAHVRFNKSPSFSLSFKCVVVFVNFSLVFRQWSLK